MTSIEYIKYLDDLTDQVKAVLSPDLLKPEYRAKWTPENPTYGHCYAASEAMYHMLGGALAGWVPHVARDHQGGTHWWIVNDSTFAMCDPTADQYYSQGVYPPHVNGRGSGFLTKQPSKRAAEIIRRVEERRKNT